MAIGHIALHPLVRELIGEIPKKMGARRTPSEGGN
jgi:hypothetical protein